MFMQVTPVNFSRNRSTEVWSNGVEQTNPPVVQGETMMHGTRKPGPTGRSPPTVCGEFLVTISSGVPGGATGGGTWSNSPSFSS
jgi:hypothetical protein